MSRYFSHSRMEAGQAQGSACGGAVSMGAASAPYLRIIQVLICA